ncbi:hypothetical protein ACJX0J_007806, partial [Zea mays]
WSNPHFQRFIELYGIGIVEVSELCFCNHWFIINTCICICCCNFFLLTRWIAQALNMFWKIYFYLL